MPSTPHKMPYTTFIPFSLWHIWIIRNKNTFKHQRLPLNLPFITNMAVGYYFLTTPKSTYKCVTPLYIK